MSPALRDPVRSLSRSSLRLITNKLPAILCDVDGQSVARSEPSLDGSSASIARTPSHESNLGDTPTSSPENEPLSTKRLSVAGSVASSITDQSQISTKFCQWTGCDYNTEMACGSLLSHIQEAHVSPQIDSKSSAFVCHWKGCKVYGRQSVSFKWLIRHVQDHSEAKGKPFSCMFKGCCQRFSSSSLLQRHIDRDHTRSKLFQSTTKKLSPQARSQSNRKFVDAYKKPRRKIYKLRHPDYIDNPTKIALQNRLYIDELLSRKEVVKEITHDLDDEPILPGSLVNGKHRDQSPLEKRNRRSRSSCSSPDDNLQQPDKVNPDVVRLLVTNPYIFVGQRVNLDNRREILVEWRGHLIDDLPPTMWVLEDEIKAASNLDDLCYLHPTFPFSSR